ncbi:triadin-like [Dorcoceras hygrometricum]|uniref:Triadin-like n=1 Tax=Dorcoceras hygrometricum TaxID=472368 RepID=A0A2Z7AUX8_9LAMI|nr:triadin-like [Dorcoceras hygrometricum]
MVFSQLPCWRLGAWLRPVSRGNRHFTVGGGRLRQSGPRPEGRLLRQPALEGLTRSARTDSPRKVGRNKFRRGAATRRRKGGGSGDIRERRGRRLLGARVRVVLVVMDTASRGPTTIATPESQFRTCPSDHDLARGFCLNERSDQDDVELDFTTFRLHYANSDFTTQVQICACASVFNSMPPQKFRFLQGRLHPRISVGFLTHTSRCNGRGIRNSMPLMTDARLPHLYAYKYQMMTTELLNPSKIISLSMSKKIEWMKAKKQKTRENHVVCHQKFLARIQEAEDSMQAQHLIIEVLVEEKDGLLQTIQGLQEANGAPAPFDDEWEEEPEEEVIEDIPLDEGEIDDEWK